MGYYGSVGNEIAWKNKGYSSLEELRKKQRPWIIGGIIVWILLVLFLFGAPLIIYLTI